jgi:hypothetical protein
VCLLIATEINAQKDPVAAEIKRTNDDESFESLLDSPDENPSEQEQPKQQQSVPRSTGSDPSLSKHSVILANSEPATTVDDFQSEAGKQVDLLHPNYTAAIDSLLDQADRLRYDDKHNQDISQVRAALRGYLPSRFLVAGSDFVRRSRGSQQL